MKLLLVDLDDTLIDTATFKHTLFSRLATIYDVDMDTVLRLYESYKNNLDTDDWIYDFTMGFDQDIWFSTKDLDRLGVPFSPIKKTLEVVKSFSGTKMVFSYGNAKLQNYKLDKLGIRDLFSNIIVTPQSKFDKLSSLINGDQVIIDNKAFDEVVIIDDNEEFLKQVRQSFPWIQTITP